MHKQGFFLPQAWRSGSARGTAAPRFRQAKFSCGYCWCKQGTSPDLGVRGRGPPDHTRGPLDFPEACVITAGLAGRARETILQMGRLRPTEGAWLAQDTLPEAGLD